jgi:hypothetical protein
VRNNIGIDEPTCFCDEAYHYGGNITEDQSMCKIPIPSIATIEHHTQPFFVTAEALQQQVCVVYVHFSLVHVRRLYMRADDIL